jgi:hypothetical protein
MSTTPKRIAMFAAVVGLASAVMTVPDASSADTPGTGGGTDVTTIPSGAWARAWYESGQPAARRSSEWDCLIIHTWGDGATDITDGLWNGGDTSLGYWALYECRNRVTDQLVQDVAWFSTVANPVAFLRERAEKALVLPEPVFQQPPSGHSVAGIVTWWWVQDVRPAPVRVQAGPVWVEVSAAPDEPDALSFDPGDESPPVVCAYPGVPWSGQDPRVTPPPCGHVYDRTSFDAPGHDYTVTTGVRWRVTWRAFDGSAGDAGTQTMSSAMAMPVWKVAALATGG